MDSSSVVVKESDTASADNANDLAGASVSGSFRNQNNFCNDSFDTTGEQVSESGTHCHSQDLVPDPLHTQTQQKSTPALDNEPSRRRSILEQFYQPTERSSLSTVELTARLASQAVRQGSSASRLPTGDSRSLGSHSHSQGSLLARENSKASYTSHTSRSSHASHMSLASQNSGNSSPTSPSGGRAAFRGGRKARVRSNRPQGRAGLDDIPVPPRPAFAEAASSELLAPQGMPTLGGERNSDQGAGRSGKQLQEGGDEVGEWLPRSALQRFSPEQLKLLEVKVDRILQMAVCVCVGTHRVSSFK